MIKGNGLKPTLDIMGVIARHPRLSSDREAELILKAQDGDYEARQTVVYSNLAWICSMGGNFGHEGIDDCELISEGYFGLNRAIDQWNPEKGGNLRTFSAKKIYKFQSEAIRQKNHIRLPRSTYEQLSKLKKATASLSEDVTVAQLAKATNIREKRIEQLQAISQPVSLNNVAGDQGNLELLDLQTDDSQGSLDPAISSELLDLIDKLHPRQREIIRLHHWEELSFQKISDVLGLPAKRVRKIYKQSLVLLRKFLQGEINEFPALPVLQWHGFVYTKIFLATGLSQIFDVAVANLKRLKRLLCKNQTAPVCSKVPVSQSATEVLPKSDLGLDIQAQAGQSTQQSAWHQRLWHFVKGDISACARNTHLIDSGGLRDGPRYFLYYCWHGIYCVAQFLGYSPGSSRGSDQPRCRSGDRWRCRGQTEGYYKKRKVKPRIYQKILPVHNSQLLRNIARPKIEFSNTINSFTRPLINQSKHRHINL